MYDMNEHCEEANKRYLINSGIGFFAQQLADIPALLQQVLDKGAELNPEFRPINWQEKLEHYLKGFFKTKTGSV